MRTEKKLLAHAIFSSLIVTFINIENH